MSNNWSVTYIAQAAGAERYTNEIPGGQKRGTRQGILGDAAGNKLQVTTQRRNQTVVPVGADLKGKQNSQ